MPLRTADDESGRVGKGLPAARKLEFEPERDCGCCTCMSLLS